NAHIIIKGVVDKVRKQIENFEIPFDRSRSALLKDYFKLDNSYSDSKSVAVESNRDGFEVNRNEDSETQINSATKKKLTRKEVQKLVQGLFFKVTNIEVIEADVELTEQGLDSISVTEFVSQLESSLKIDIDSDLIFEYPLPDQFIDEIHSFVQKAE
ncbi:MAG: acyl carrier protein, partial [Candidatus Heimdallarchaeota archaeon]|nr:acyl carrier protein [Candidatus Heimdallarchaeota archaeon]